MQLFFFQYIVIKKMLSESGVNHHIQKKSLIRKLFVFLDDIKMKVLSQLLELLVYALSVLNVL